MFELDPFAPEHDTPTACPVFELDPFAPKHDNDDDLRAFVRYLFGDNFTAPPLPCTQETWDSIMDKMTKRRLLRAQELWTQKAKSSQAEIQAKEARALANQDREKTAYSEKSISMLIVSACKDFDRAIQVRNEAAKELEAARILKLEAIKMKQDAEVIQEETRQALHVVKMQQIKTQTAQYEAETRLNTSRVIQMHAELAQKKATDEAKKLRKLQKEVRKEKEKAHDEQRKAIVLQQKALHEQTIAKQQAAKAKLQQEVHEQERHKARQEKKTAKRKNKKHAHVSNYRVESRDDDWQLPPYSEDDRASFIAFTGNATPLTALAVPAYAAKSWATVASNT